MVTNVLCSSVGNGKNYWEIIIGYAVVMEMLRHGHLVMMLQFYMVSMVLCVMVVIWRHWTSCKKKELKRVYGQRVQGERVYEKGVYVEAVQGKRVYGKEVSGKRVYEREAYHKKYMMEQKRGGDIKGNCGKVSDRKGKIKKGGADKKGGDIKENGRESGGYRKCGGRKAFVLYFQPCLIYLP
eukprot:119519_1